jgi:hypothetical protein
MDRIIKSLALLLVLTIAISSLIMVKPASAQSLSAPEFTIQLGVASGDVPTTYKLIAGQIVANAGYHYEKTTVNIIINNSPYAFTYQNQGTANLFYDVRVKNSLWNSWTDLCNNTPSDYFVAGNREFENISVPPQGNSTDIQVKAMVGNFISQGTLYSNYEFQGVTSEWSKTQTALTSSNITVFNVASPSPFAISPTENKPSFTVTLGIIDTATLIIIAILLAIIVALLLMFRHRKTANLYK